MWLLAFIALLLVAAIGVQVYYAKTYWAQANNWAKGIWIVNIVLLSGLTVGLLWLAYQRAGG